MRCSKLASTSLVVLAVACDVGGIDDRGSTTRQGLESAIACGNGVRENGEECDDGNVLDGDGCSAGCALEVRLLAGSPCGLRDPRDTSACCGNRSVESGERCDDGNDGVGDGCDAECELEAGFTCFDVVSAVPQDAPPSYTRCEPDGCGDGAIRGAEECDDWNLVSGDGCSPYCEIEPGFSCGEAAVVALPEVFAHRTVDCVVLACGNGALDPGELCDDGAANGFPGFCSTACDDLEPMVRLDEDAYELRRVPGIVGLLPSETDLIPICGGEAIDLDGFAQVRDLLDGAGVVMGRLMRANADFLVDNPVIFLGDPGSLGDASLMFSPAGSVEPALGSFQVREGQHFVAPIAIGGALPGCDCGMPRDDCVDMGGRPGTEPGCLEGLTCPEARMDNAVELRPDHDLPDDVLGDPIGAIGDVVSCSRTCWFAGNPAICDDDPTGDVELPVPDRCTVEAPDLPTGTGFSRDICPYVMSPVLYCGGACDDVTGACNWLESQDTSRGDECWISGEPGALASTALCPLDDPDCGCARVDVPPGAIPETLTPPQVLAACYGGGAPPDAKCVFPNDQGPLADPDDVAPFLCSKDERECLYCPSATGGGCLPIEPRERAVGDGLRVLARSALWTQVQHFEAEEDERHGRLSEAQLRGPGHFDPRLAGGGGATAEPATTDDPVFSATGELLIEATDVSFPSEGVPFEFVRTYRSGGQRSGSLGPGWSHNYEERLEFIGDPYNRLAAPAYCLTDLPTIRCLLHHDGHGGSQLYVFDPRTGVFVPNPGAFGVIRAELSDDIHKLMRIPIGVPRLVLTEPGGTAKTFDISGVLLSVKDERGLGVELAWELLGDKDVENNGAWSNVLPPGLLPPDPRSQQAAAAHSAWLNRLNRLRLAGARDSYGREFKFEYETYFEDGQVAPSGPYRRSRLTAVTYRGAPLVLYGHTEFELTHDAYLTEVKRIGLYEELEPAEPIVTTYEYQHDIFMAGPGSTIGALQVDDPHAGVLTSKSKFATRVLGDLERFGARLHACTAGREGLFDPDTLRGDCGAPIVPVGGADAYGIATAPMFDVLREHLADNIVRVRRGGSGAQDIELESFFDPDPTSPDFDRVVRQRYGSLPAPRRVPALVAPPGGDEEGVFVHRWFTDAPETSLAQVTGVDPNAQPPALLDLVSPDSDGGPAENPALRAAWFAEGHRVPAEALAAVPLVGHERLRADGRADELQTCERLDRAQLLPFFAVHEPVGARSDQRRMVVARTTASCQSVAARHARDAFLSDEILLPEDADFRGTRRELLEADLALVCRWVQHTDRTGAVTTTGLNFMGQALVDASPSPADTGLAITVRRFNADGLLVFERRADGSRTELAWGALVDESDLDFLPGATLRRGLLRSVVEYPATDEALELALEERPNGDVAPVASRAWQYDYEPAFQQVSREVQPDLTVIEHLYDWQQLASTSQQRPFLARLAYRTRIKLAPADFFARDLDGDGTVGEEDSAGLVLSVVRGVDLGERIADVGIRRTLNDAGCVVAERRVKDAEDPGQDFDFTTYAYYEDLAHAEAGDLDTDDGCRAHCGPLALTTRLRSKSASVPSDRARVFVAYDALGGVRLMEENDDAETRGVTVRNSVGQVVLEERPGGLEVRSTYDDRGQMVEQVAADVAAGSTMLPRVTRSAWGAQGVSLGSCVEIDDRACQAFDGFALEVQRRHRDGVSFPAPLQGASYVVPLFDREDREVGSLDAEGGIVSRLRNAAGLVVREEVEASPPLVTRYRHDALGRAVAVVRGDGDDELVALSRYDRLSRLVAVQSHVAPGSDAFRDGAGTIERYRYDLLDRQMSRVVEGDDGTGERRLLSVERVERNQVGAGRFTHRFSGALSSTERARPTGKHAGDDWVTEERRYDAALRPVLVAAEGLTAATVIGWDGLGIREVDGATVTARVSVDPSARTRTITRDILPDGDGAELPTTVEVSRFDGRGLLVEESARDERDGVERVSSYRHDALGQKVAAVDPAGRGARVVFDRAGRPEAVTEHGPSGAVERETGTVFDQMGRALVERPAVDAPPTELVRDAAGRVVESASGAGSGRFVHRMAFDAAGRLASTTSIGLRSRVTALAYAEGFAAPETLRVDGQLAKTMTRDGLERVVSATDRNLVAASDARFAASRPALSTSRSFDTLGRVVGEATRGDFPPLSPTLPGQGPVSLAAAVTSFDDDALGPKSLHLQSGTDFTFHYSSQGNLTELSRAGMQTVGVTFSYEGSLWVRAAVQGAHAWQVEKRRDAFGFIVGSGLGLAGAAAPLSEDAVLRGPTGKVTAELRRGEQLGARLKGFRYDGLGRLLAQRFAGDTGLTFEELLGETAAALSDEDAGADLVQGADNALTASLTDADVVVGSTEDQHRRSFLADVDATAAGVPPARVNGRRVTRDEQQRIASDDELQYTFDVFDRLVQVRRGPTEELRLAYDGLGRRRLERRRMLGGHVEDAVLEYLGGNVVEEAAAGSGAVLVATTHAQGLDAPLVVTIAGETTGPPANVGDATYVLRTNARGDAVAAVDDAGGLLVEEQDLDPWGEREIAINPGQVCVEGDEGRDLTRRVSLPSGRCAPHARVLGRFGIAGARGHPGTKLVDLRNRVYAPHLRGFLTKDPLGTVDSQGLHAYAQGDPINLRDPWGLKTQGGQPVCAGTESGGNCTQSVNGGEIDWSKLNPLVGVDLDYVAKLIGQAVGSVVTALSNVRGGGGGSGDGGAGTGSPAGGGSGGGGAGTGRPAGGGGRADTGGGGSSAAEIAEGLALAFFDQAERNLEQVASATDPLAPAKAAVGVAIHGPSALNPFGAFSRATSGAASSCVNGGVQCVRDVANAGSESAKLLGGAFAGRLGGSGLPSGGLFRRGANTGAFAELPVLMTMKRVKQVAAQAGIGLEGVTVRIVRERSLIGRNVYGYTYPSGARINLYPDAFSSTENLVKTLGHERMHVMQVQIYGKTASTVGGVANEAAAYGSEGMFWDFFRGAGVFGGQ